MNEKLDDKLLYDVLNDIKKSKYSKKDVDELLYELEKDTGNYSNYDIGMAIIYYKNLYEQEKNKAKDKKKDLKEKMKLNLKELKKNPDPVNSKFHSFDEYFKWRNELLKENEKIEYILKNLF